MSKCIDTSSRKNSELYKATLKEGCTNEMCKKYINYHNHYNQLKRTAKFNYYKQQVDESKTNTKKLWRVINNVIGKNKNKGSIIPYITVEGVHKYNPTTITNEFRCTIPVPIIVLFSCRTLISFYRKPKIVPSSTSRV